MTGWRLSITPKNRNRQMSLIPAQEASQNIITHHIVSQWYLFYVWEAVVPLTGWQDFPFLY